ncbi:putative clathrin assembly protein At2g25430 [Ziziphus jujuba]|uniref:Clathrin assembly protein At2g25430 n=1 Tax=Ziziphus jujuba TaxID=326968 RepID=A0A6P4ARN3_ZIZJJ|nr:putative clathrin assembly protein At2g25430 [Ziziphus jujuba]
MQKRLRKVLTSLKEHSTVNYAKMVTVGGFCNMDLLIIKATSPNDLPLPEKYIQELLKIFSISQSSFQAFSLSFTRRFGKTKCWRVALKCLLLLHRLLRSLPQNSPLRTELIWTRSNGLISLSPCRFRDQSSSASDDYTAFIRSYAQLLDEVLNYYSLGNKETQEHDHNQEEQKVEDHEESLSDKMKRMGKILEVLPHLQSLIDRAMDCRPFGSAARSFMVQSAMKQIIRDSFVCYTTYRKEIVVVLDNLFQLPYKSSVSAFGIYKKAAVQSNQLCEFYDWCKAKGLCGSYEYPFIERIPQIQIQALENLLKGMWELTVSSTSPSGSSSSVVEEFSQSSSTEEDDKRDRKFMALSENKSVIPRKFCGEDEEPLIKFEDHGDEDESWETLLDASINMPPGHPNLLCFNNCNGYGEDHGIGIRSQFHGEHQEVDPKMQNSNQNALAGVRYPCAVPNYQGSFGFNNTYPWGL